MRDYLPESETEEFTIELLEKSGYQYIHSLDIAPDGDTPERNRFEDVLLLESPQSPVGKITQSKTKIIDAKDDPGIINKQIYTLEKLRDTLLPKLMSREVRVKI